MAEGGRQRAKSPMPGEGGQGSRALLAKYSVCVIVRASCSTALVGEGGLCKVMRTGPEPGT